MTSFKISLVLFVFLIAIIVLNAVYVKNKSAYFTDALASLPSVSEPDCVALCEKLHTEWTHDVRFLGFSSSVDDLERISRLFISLVEYAKSNNSEEFLRTRELLIFCVTEIESLERFKIEDIF